MLSVLKKNSLYIGNFLFAFLILSAILLMGGFAPFGNKSLAIMDASIQYLDFFAYWKDVLLGQNSATFTFSNLLGSGNWSQITYYLLSPFNLLVMFFSKENLNTFFDLVVILKLSLAAMTSAIFLNVRTKYSLKKWLLTLLALSYALMQYNIAQSSNIMWLDGVYLLPLSLLGVYLVTQQRSHGIYLLALSIGFGLIINWYVGAINCLFSFGWLILEICLAENITLKQTRGSILSYAWAMIIGIMISAVTFLPTISSMGQQSRSGLDWSLVTNTFRGNILSVIPGYTLGATSSPTNVSLFCGSLVLLGAVSLFFSSGFRTKEKLVLGIFLIIALLMYYWQPLCMLFSLLKDATSYWYRYSYVGSMFLIFMASLFFEKWSNEPKNNIVPLLKATISIVGIAFVAWYFLPKVPEIRWVQSGIFLGMIVFILCLVSDSHLQRYKKYVVVSLCLLVGSELSYNTYLLIMNMFSEVKVYQNYVKQQDSQITALKKYDTGYYRISQTKAKGEEDNINITANYNEAYSFNYWSIASYISSPSGTQLKLLSDLGYRTEGDRISIVNTSILPTDSFLGVKYILSPYPIKGLKKLTLQKANEKDVYKNPYALPLGFIVRDIAGRSNGLNVFDYENEVYTQATAMTTKIFKPLAYEKVATKSGMRYKFKIPTGNYSVYGSLPWKWSVDGTRLDLNGKMQQVYSTWLSPSVFYVPTTDEDSGYIELQTDDQNAFNELQLYLLDLNQLAKVTNVLKEQSVDVKLNVENGKANFTVDNKQNKRYLQTTIPYESGWVVKLNGKEIMPKLLDNTLMALPLEKGKNNITMEYHVVHLKLGTLLTLVGIILLSGTWYLTKKYNRGRK
ncbi:YfhO family protein [Lactobacillus sp. AN1001]